jgi:predicted phosphodiesterase
MSYRPRLNKHTYEFINYHKNSNVVGIISDTHYPFAHPKHLQFLYETFNKFQVNRVVHIGDIVDGSAWNMWEKSAEMPCGSKEAEMAQKDMDKLFKMFPNGDLTMGNHDELINRRMLKHSIPQKFYKTFSESWNFPKGWKTHTHIEIDNVMYLHGTGKSGVNASVSFMQDYRQSVVTGHTHSSGGINYRASYKELCFALNVGCLIGSGLAFAYGKHFSKKPTLGCGIVVEGKHGFFIPMDLGTKITYK